MFIFLLVVAAVILVFVFKGGSSNGDTATPGVDPVAAIAQSEFAALFAQNVCQAFNPGGEHYQWMIANAKERMVKLDFTKQLVAFKKIEVNRHRLKENGTYDVETSAIGFGASGYQDLPNSGYVSAFRSYIEAAIRENCPSVTIDSDGYIKVAPNAMKSW